MGVLRYPFLGFRFKGDGNDEGVKISLEVKVNDEIDMIKGNFHVINGTCKLSLLGPRLCFVINAAFDIFPGGFNTEFLRKIIAKPSAI